MAAKTVRVALVDLALHRGGGGREPDRVVVGALAALGLDPVVAAGAVIEVPAQLAGRPPGWRPVTGSDDPLHRSGDASGFFERRSEPDGPDEVYDLGEGLLAQVGIWQLATTTEASGKEG